MSTAPTSTATSLITPCVPIEQIRVLDGLALECSPSKLIMLPAFEKTFIIAAAMEKIDSLITTEMMRPIMRLMNTRLGFRTDKDPARPGKNGTPTPYSEQIVRQCLIQSVFLGVRPVGNEFNIIAADCYVTKEGFYRKVREVPNLSGLKVKPSLPQFTGGGAIVKIAATWKLNGVPQGIERELAIRVNEGQGADAILGKAERKILAAAWQQISNEDDPVPDGSADEFVFDVESRPVNSKADAPRGPATSDTFTNPKGGAVDRPYGGDIEARRLDVLQKFARLKPKPVTKPMLEEYVKNNFKDFTAAELDSLEAVLPGLQSGDLTWQGVVGELEEPDGEPRQTKGRRSTSQQKFTE